MPDQARGTAAGGPDLPPTRPRAAGDGPAGSSGASRLALSATLAVVMAAGPLAVFALSALGPVVTAELHLSHSQFGLLATLAFMVAAPSAVILGRWVDRYPARRILVGVFALSGLSVTVTAVAPSFGWLLVGVLIGGVAMSVTNPVTNRVVTRHVPPGQRGGLMGTKQSGVQVSQFLIGLTLPGLAEHVGWRTALAATLTMVLVGFVLTYLFIPVAARTAPPTAARQGGPRGTVPSDVWLLLAYSFLTGAAIQSTNAYLPLFAFERLSLSSATAGFTVSVVGGIGLVARIMWGRAADRSRKPWRILAAMSASGAMATCLLAAASSTTTAWLIWAAAALSGATVVASNVVVMMTLVRVVDVRLVGTATGLLALGLYAGFAAGPVSFGLLVEAVGYASAWLVVAGAYSAAALLVLAARRTAGDLPAHAAALQEADDVAAL